MCPLARQPALTKTVTTCVDGGGELENYSGDKICAQRLQQKKLPMVSDDDEGCLISCPAKLTSTRGFLRASWKMRDTCWSPMARIGCIMFHPWHYLNRTRNNSLRTSRFFSASSSCWRFYIFKNLVLVSQFSQNGTFWNILA